MLRELRRLLTLGLSRRPLGGTRRRRRVGLPPAPEALERRLTLSATGVVGAAARVGTPPGGYAREVASRSPTPSNRPAMSAADSVEDAIFIDPTARLARPTAIRLGSPSAILPFAVLDASGGPIRTGSRSLVSDHVHIVAGGPRGVVLGDNTILGHGATILGPARVGASVPGRK